MDLDGDGILDVLSGSWPGEIHLFRGKGKGEFAAAERLRHPDGRFVNAGGRRQGGSIAGKGEMVLFAGDASVETTDKATVVVYGEERFELPKGTEVGITGTASVVQALDVDGDGDLDLVVGEIDGPVWLVPNEGKPKAWAWGKEVPLLAGGKALKVAGDAGPHAADWDGDGRTDLLVGAGDGSVTFFRNAGKGPAMELGAGVVLVPPAKTGYGKDAPTEPRRGSRAKVCAADWNGDGRLDLLLGDYATLRTVRPEPTAAEKAAEDALRKELEELAPKYAEAWRRTQEAKDEAAEKAASEEMSRLLQRMQEIRGKLPEETEDHGWVWLFLRKAPPGEGK